MRSVALSVVFVVLLCLGATPVVAAGAATEGGSITDSTSTFETLGPATEPSVLQLQTEIDDTPSTVFRIDLQSNQDADWEVTVEYDLETESQQAAFRAIAEEFEDGTAPTGGLSVDLYENMAGFASDETGRQMAIENVERTSSLSGTTGTLSLSFTWSAFLEADGERLVFNDALQTPDDGTWLGSLDENQELRITTPRDYAITSANVAFSDNTVTVDGPHTFDREDHVRIILEPSSFTGIAWELLAAAVVVAAAIVGGAFLLGRRDSDDTDGPTQTATGGDTATQTASTGGPDTPPEPETPPNTETTPESDEQTEPDEDLSLLADDERVLRLLERNGGRMRQAEIVSETNWSDAKVSQLLSSMADDDQITKLRIGRENLISLPDVDALDGSKRDDDE